MTIVTYTGYVTENEMIEWAEAHGYRHVGAGNWRRICERCTYGKTLFTWVYDGDCFKCNASRQNFTGTYGKSISFAEVQKRVARNEKAKAKRDAEREEKRQQEMAENAERLAREEAERVARENAQVAAKARFQFVGEVGEKVEFDGEVVFVKYIPAERYDRSGTNLVIVKVSDDVKVKFFTSAVWVAGLEKGDHVHVAATVKVNDEWNGEKVSQLVRPKGSKIEEMVTA